MEPHKAFLNIIHVGNSTETTEKNLKDFFGKTIGRTEAISVGFVKKSEEFLKNSKEQLFKRSLSETPKILKKSLEIYHCYYNLYLRGLQPYAGSPRTKSLEIKITPQRN